MTSCNVFDQLRLPTMDSSKLKDAKKKKGGNKACASTAQVAEGRPKFSSTFLNDLPPEIIDLIADSLSIMDCLNTQKAFARDPEQAVIKIRKGLAINLAKQRALYLLMDLNEYDGMYQYNYQMESQLPQAFLPTLEGLSIASEFFKVITLPELLPGGSLISIGRLKRTFPKVVELKVVLREWSPVWLAKLAKVVAAFSRQLTALQLLIFSDSLELTTPWGTNYLLRMLSHLNDAHFDRLRHFTLLFEDTEETRIHPIDMKLLRLLSSETLEECYLRLPGKVIEPQLMLLGENEGLQRLGIIASYCGDFNFQLVNNLETMMVSNRKIQTSPSLAAKTVHLLFPDGYRSQKVDVSFSCWQIDLNRLEQYTSLRTLRIRLITNEEYLTLMEKLSKLDGSLTHLKIRLRYFPVSKLAFCRPLSQLAPCSPSVTHLKIQVVSIYKLNLEGEAEERRLRFSHLIFSHLSILRHFPNLQQLEVAFPRAYSCSLCNLTPGDDGRECMEMAMQPFRARDQLKASFSRF